MKGKDERKKTKQKMVYLLYILLLIEYIMLQ